MLAYPRPKLDKLHESGARPHVGIIGAGVSGLRCADTLLRNGFAVTILEARQRVGGRVHQEEICGRLVDMGANWIHGRNSNPMTQLASITNSKAILDDSGMIFFDGTGHQISKRKANKCAGFVWDTLESAMEYSRKQSGLIDCRRSVLHYVNGKIRRSQLDADCKHICTQMVHMYSSESGEEIESQSLKHFYFEDGDDGEDGTDVFLASTYKDIIEQVGRAATDGKVIEFGQEVIQIESLPPTVDRKAITLTAATGRRMSFDEVVVTCPLGWLKRHKTAFKPPLTVGLEQAIDRIGYGALEKVFVSFPAAFWVSQNHVKDLSEPVRDRRSSQGSPFTFWCYLSPLFHPLTEKLGNWTQEFISLADLPEGEGHPTLVFYVGPPCSRSLIPSLAGIAPHSDTYDAILRSFCEPFYSRLPNYDGNDPNCHPVSLLATQWQNDPFAGNGSYVSFQTGLVNAKSELDMLKNGGEKGLSGETLMGRDRGVWFAGEHTAPPRGIGTTTGAWWSGERAARSIARAYGKKRLKKDGIGPVVL